MGGGVISIQKGSSWGLSFLRFLGAEFFRFLGAEFFRFLGAEFFSKKTKNTAHHLHLLVQGHGSGCLLCFPLFLFFLCLCS